MFTRITALCLQRSRDYLEALLNAYAFRSEGTKLSSRVIWRRPALPHVSVPAAGICITVWSQVWHVASDNLKRGIHPVLVDSFRQTERYFPCALKYQEKFKHVLVDWKPTEGKDKRFHAVGLPVLRQNTPSAAICPAAFGFMTEPDSRVPPLGGVNDPCTRAGTASAGTWVASCTE